MKQASMAQTVNGKWEKRKWKKGGNERLQEDETRFFLVGLKNFETLKFDAMTTAQKTRLRGQWNSTKILRDQWFFKDQSQLMEDAIAAMPST